MCVCDEDSLKMLNKDKMTDSDQDRMESVFRFGVFIVDVVSLYVTVEVESSNMKFVSL